MRKRRRVWFISPEGFRELRHSCLLSRQRAAEYLGVSVRTIRHWDAGRNRVPWSVVRLLRLRRAGELGGLLDGWEGWTIWRDRLVSPCGRVYLERDMRHWWLTIEQAHLFREGYDRAVLGGVGAEPPRSDWKERHFPTLAARSAARTLPGNCAAGRHGDHASPATALDRPHAPEKAPDASAAGKAAGAASGRAGALPSQWTDTAANGGHGVNVASEWHHETANCGGNLGACNMEQTAPLSRLSLPDTVCGKVPWANRDLPTLTSSNLASLWRHRLSRPARGWRDG